MREHEKNRSIFSEIGGTGRQTYISIGFIRLGTIFNQTNHSNMQLLGGFRDILALDLGKTFALKNLEEILEGITTSQDIKKISSELTW